MQDAGGLMGAPVRVDIGAVPEKKVGDFEVVIDDRPREREGRAGSFDLVITTSFHERPLPAETG
jgi:hypothetical protein